MKLSRFVRTMPPARLPILRSDTHGEILALLLLSPSDANPVGAFSLAYDAACKALTAILANQGLRPRGSTGGHTVLLDVVLAQLDPPLGNDLREFDWMRHLRNDSAYPVPVGWVRRHTGVRRGRPTAVRRATARSPAGSNQPTASSARTPFSADWSNAAGSKSTAPASNPSHSATSPCSGWSGSASTAHMPS
jgi:hypothetical protein